MIPKATDPATVKVRTEATSRLPKFGPLSRGSFAYNQRLATNGLLSGLPISSLTALGEAKRFVRPVRSTVPALTLAAVYN